jgi:hypothetical protein
MNFHDKVFIFQEILIDLRYMVLLPMLINHFNGCARARNLSIAAQIKIMKEPSLVFTGPWFIIYLWLPSGKYKIVFVKKEFKGLEDLLVPFRLYFVSLEITRVSLPCTIYYSKYMWY